MKEEKVMKKFYIFLSVIAIGSLLVSEVNADSVRVGLADFVNRTSESYNTYALTKVNDIFKSVLSNSSNNLEVISTQNSFSNVDDAIISGKSAGYKYIILGALIDNDINSSTSSSFSGGLLFTTSNVKAKTQIKQRVNLDIRIIEIATGKIIFSTSGTGVSSYSYSYNPASTNDMEKLSKTAQERYDAIFEKAIYSASSMATEKICAFLTGEYPKVSIIKNTNVKKSKTKKKNKKDEISSLGSIKIDRGTSTGAIEDAFYRIFFEGEEVFDLNGNSLGQEKFNIAIAQVKDIQTNSCIADVKGGKFSNIRNGDKAEQISSEEAEAIVARNDFASNRISEFLK